MDRGVTLGGDQKGLMVLNFLQQGADLCLPITLVCRVVMYVLHDSAIMGTNLSFWSKVVTRSCNSSLSLKEETFACVNVIRQCQ